MEVNLRVIFTATLWLGSVNRYTFLYTFIVLPELPCSALPKLYKTLFQSVLSHREGAGYL